MVPNSRMAKDDQRRHDGALDEDAREVHDFPASSFDRIDGLHLGAGEEAQLAVGHHGVAGRDALLDHHLLAEGAARR